VNRDMTDILQAAEIVELLDPRYVASIIWFVGFELGVSVRPLC
jgi:hypothetical protein